MPPSLELLTRENPWVRTPGAPPYVLPGDATGAAPYRLEKIPSPWSGPAFTADVVMLLLNPGFGEQVDHQDLRDPEFVALCRAQLSGVDPFPWLLQRWSATGASGYWRPRLRHLCADVGDGAIAERFATIQWTAYASKTWEPPSAPIPSQEFTAEVVRAAIARDALIVVARSWAQWMALVPELTGAPVLRLRSPRSPFLTPGNVGDEGYRNVVKRLRA